MSAAIGTLENTTTICSRINCRGRRLNDRERVNTICRETRTGCRPVRSSIGCLEYGTVCSGIDCRGIRRIDSERVNEAPGANPEFTGAQLIPPLVVLKIAASAPA